MGSGVFSIGVSALQVAQLGLATTSHNIANSSTDGYSRQRIIQSANVAVLTGAGYIGSGSHVTTVERVYSSFIASQINTAQAKVSSLQSYADNIANLDSTLSDSDSGISTALEDFFSSISDVSSDPTSTTTRQTMVSAAETLAARFQSLNDLVNQQYENVNSQLQSTISTVNSYAQQISALNLQITKAESSSTQQPNDLYDQRDQLITELNQYVGVTTTTNSDGSYNVYFGNGQPLVTGTQTTTLVATPSSEDASRLTLGVKTTAGNVELPESLITGGSLAGILQYRSESLDSASAELGTIAATVALTFNAQHALGQDLLGDVEGDTNFVSDFFTISSPTVVANTNNPASAVDVSATYSTASQSDDGTFYTNLTASNYRLQYDGTTMTLTRLSDNTSWSVNSNDISDLNTAIAASSDGEQGFTLSATGTLVAGSSYLIKPTGDAAESVSVNSAISSDVRLVALAAPIATSADSSNTGSATISDGSVSTGYSMSNLPLTLSYDSSAGTLTGFPSGIDVTVTVDGTSTTYNTASSTVPYTSGATISFDGLSFSISGIPADGDQFTIDDNSSGVSDSRNAILLGDLQTGKTMSGNTATFATVYAQLVSDVGNKASEIDTLQTTQETILSNAQDSMDSYSGVNLDEEAANLLQYQQAYQAAAKVLEIASTLFDSILSIGS